MKSLELFSGLGGLAKGLEISGFEHVKFVESNHDACNSLRENFNENLIYEGDIRNFDATPFRGIDLVAGGPPCQPFSLGGKGKAHNDARDMFPEAARIISECRPRAFIFENVKGLLRKNFSDYFSYILLRLQFPLERIRRSESWQSHYHRLSLISRLNYKKVHYNVCYKLINAADYGVPQVRERVFIVGVRSDLNLLWSFPPQTHSKEKLYEAQKCTGSYWKKYNIEFNSVNYQEVMLNSSIKPWVTVRDALSNIPDPEVESNFALDHVFKGGAKIYPGHTGSEFDMPAKTIKAGAHGVPGGENMIRYPDGKVRYMTTYEAKIIQTFPKDYVVTGSWGESLRQIGNAVPVHLATILGKQLYDILNNN